MQTDPIQRHAGNRSERPMLVLMHFLGGSTREWDEVVALLGPQYGTLRVDLPGFGDSTDVPGYSVAEMANAVFGCISRAGLKRFVLVGHSMSGKVAMVLARLLEDDPRLVSGTLAALVLVAPSPPSPEPIPDEKRSFMLGLFNGVDRPRDVESARSYITKNEERDIAPAVLARSVSEVLRMNRAAWSSWLNSGSREDWSARVSILTLPTLVVAGELDRSLGPQQQQLLTLPHLSHGLLHVVPACSHLVPLERPETMAELLRGFLAGVEPVQGAISSDYLALIDSERVSPRTRQVLEARMAGPEPSGEPILTTFQQRTLTAMLGRIIPQPPGDSIDLSGFLLARLAAGKGNGWRYAVLPNDLQAYREGLDRLGEADFVNLPAEEQDGVLRKLSAQPGSPEAHWFEEVRSDAAEVWAAHPATLARIGYSGIGVGGAHTPHQGFVSFGANQREAWEPVAETTTPR